MAESGQEKTEKATPKKRQDARKRGQVMKSMEVNTAFCTAVMFAFMLIAAPGAIDALAGVYKSFLSSNYLLHSEALTIPFVQGLYIAVLSKVAGILIPVFGVALACGLLVNLLQVGFLFTVEPLKPKLSKISPISGLKRMFSLNSLTQLLKSILKVVCVGYVLYSEYSTLLVKFPTLMGADIYTTIVEVMRLAFTIALKMAMVLALVAAFDYLYQWWKFEKDLKMTKQEVKDEYKNAEGDPQIRNKIRQKQRQMSMMRMMEQVPQADVVITNPTHFAVALRYREGKDSAPVVVAKGQDFIARRIKEVAREHYIDIIENKPLARSLCEMCEVGGEIPEEFYQAVADILVYVYRQKQRVPSKRA